MTWTTDHILEGDTWKARLWKHADDCLPHERIQVITVGEEWITYNYVNHITTNPDHPLLGPFVLSPAEFEARFKLASRKVSV